MSDCVTCVHFSDEELIALAKFFGEDGTMVDEIYDRLSKRFLVAAVKAGLDEDLEET